MSLKNRYSVFKQLVILYEQAHGDVIGEELACA